MKNFTLIALATLGVAATGVTGVAGAVAAFEINQCQEANKTAQTYTRGYENAAKEVQRIGDAMIANPFTAILKVNDLIEANGRMNEAKGEATEMADLAAGVCDPVTTTERFAHSVFPTAFASDNGYDVTRVSQTHAIWQSRKTTQLTSWLGDAVDFFTTESTPSPVVNSAPPVRPVTNSVNSSNVNTGTAPTTAEVLFQMEVGGPLVSCQNCVVEVRTNSNGHKVYDVIESNGYTRSVVLWNDGSVEVFSGMKGSDKTRRVGTWVERNGMAHVNLGGTFAFTI